MDNCLVLDITVYPIMAMIPEKSRNITLLGNSMSSVLEKFLRQIEKNARIPMDVPYRYNCSSVQEAAWVTPIRTTIVVFLFS